MTYPAILDGKKVDASEITPEKHRFIGVWRDPTPPSLRWSPSLNGCSICNNSYKSLDACWREGHWDLQQYVTISTS